MLRLLRNKRAQSTAEYAILIALVVAAIVGMQTYVKRGLQARVKDAGDDYVNALGNSEDWANITNKEASLLGQFEDTRLSSRSTQEVLEDSQKLNMQEGGTISREVIQRTQQAAGDYQQYDYTKE